MRLEKGVDRQKLAQAAGISYTSLYRLEAGMAPNAPLWWYTNCAIALGVKLDEIFGPEEQQWRPSSKAPAPPAPDWAVAEAKPTATSAVVAPARRFRKSNLAAPD